MKDCPGVGPAFKTGLLKGQQSMSRRVTGLRESWQECLQTQIVVLFWVLSFISKKNLEEAQGQLYQSLKEKNRVGELLI